MAVAAVVVAVVAAAAAANKAAGHAVPEVGIAGAAGSAMAVLGSRQASAVWIAGCSLRIAGGWDKPLQRLLMDRLELGSLYQVGHCSKKLRSGLARRARSAQELC